MEPARDRFAPRADVVFAERFRLVREIGRGGMATVWLAHHLRLDSPCAVKFVGESFGHPSARERFEREAKAAARLRSPHVVQVFDCGVWEDIPYIAMEYLAGEDLNTRLGRVGRLSIEETFQIAVQVGRALSKAHAELVVHRDLKPANIFLVREDDREIVKVLDFGIAKIVQTASGITLQEPGLVGTPQYMSPEQAHGRQPVDHRTDLWALGVIVFQCLTGVNPFAAEDVTACLLRIVSEPIPMPSSFPVGLPAGLDAWWARAVSRDREDRFPDAKQMLGALAAVLGIDYQDRTLDALVATTARRVLPLVEPAAPTIRVQPRGRSGLAVVLTTAAIASAGLLAYTRLAPWRQVPRPSPAVVERASPPPAASPPAGGGRPGEATVRPETAATTVNAPPARRPDESSGSPARAKSPRRHPVPKARRSAKIDLGF